MYYSLKACSDDFHLFIFAFDDLSYSLLLRMNLQYVTVISLNEFETPQLLEVKKNRSKAEYCWTCTPSTIDFVLKKFDLYSCTYIDADLIFYSDPSVLIREMIDNKKNVLITEHRFSPLAKIYEEKRAGRFCVQFVTFTNETDSLVILEKWKSQCIDWCYARHEDGKFGDQKYLDDWPYLYNNVHILQHYGTIAPWNIQQFQFKMKGEKLTGKFLKNQSTFEVVFFHFQYVKFVKHEVYDIGWYIIPSYIKRMFYYPYLLGLKDIDNKLHELCYEYNIRFTGYNSKGIKNFLKTLFKISFGYNILKNI